MSMYVRLASPPAHGSRRERNISVLGGVGPNTAIEGRLLLLCSISLRRVASLKESVEFFLRIEYHDDEGRARHVFSAPSNFYAVIAGFCGFVLAKDGPVFLGFPLHLHTESTFRSPNPYSELSCSGSPGVANEARLIPCQDTMLNSRPVNANFPRIWG